MNKKVCVCSNNMPVSLETKELLTSKLIAAGFTVFSSLEKSTDLIISIGGDGATLSFIQQFGFPSVPIIGINTGHLGFFQEINPDQLDEFIDNYINNKYALQPLATVQATIHTEEGTFIQKGLNEIVIKSNSSSAAHLDIYIDETFIEKFSGDGLVISTPAGSTAYNYSIGGAIVDPRIKLLQVAPIAPMNTTAYRSFTSSLLLPPDISVEVKPNDYTGENLSIISDGVSNHYKNMISIRIEFAKEVVNLLRFESYEFWDKVTSKFL